MTRAIESDLAAAEREASAIVADASHRVARTLARAQMVVSTRHVQRRRRDEARLALLIDELAANLVDERARLLAALGEIRAAKLQALRDLADRIGAVPDDPAGLTRHSEAVRESTHFAALERVLRR